MDAVEWLLIDSCGRTAMMALCAGPRALVERRFAGRAFSAEWAGALREMLGADAAAARLRYVAVVLGPGSFTGVRTGLAAGKGLCVALGVPMIGLSRLAVMERTQSGDLAAVMDAGRGEIYLRLDGVERLVSVEEARVLLRDVDVVAEEESLRAVLAESRVCVVDATVDAAVLMAWEQWTANAFEDVSLIDARYGRGERDIYPPPAKSSVAL